MRFHIGSFRFRQPLCVRSGTVALMMALACFLAAGQASAQEGEPRYAIELDGDRIVRLDRETGTMTLCERRGGRLVCRLAADERSALLEEIAGLNARIDALERAASLSVDDNAGETGAREEGEGQPADGEGRDGPLAQSPSPRDGEETETPAGELDEFDRAIDLSTRMLRRFFEVIREFRDEMSQNS